MNKLNVALGLFRMLSENREINARMVAEHFEVSKRTAQRYLEEISFLPFIHRDEERYTYSLTEKVTLSDSILKSAEMSFLNAVLGYAKTVMGEQNSPMLDKISKKLQYAGNSTHQIISSPAIDYDIVAEHHIKLEECIENRLLISFYYEKSDKNYTVEPYKIILHNGFWYLAAGHNNTLKKFVLEYIQDIKSSGKNYSEIPQEFAEILSSAKSMWFEQGKSTTITAHIGDVAASYITRKPFLNNQHILEEHSDGSITIKFDVANEIELLQLLSPWIEYVSIIQPENYRVFFKEIGQKITKQNS
jgi:predicted DNA-binding transcriptional regulator YafY